MQDDGKPQEAITQIEAHFEHFSGPIPPPGAMQGYEDVLSGSADRILSMAEFGQRHRASYENRGLSFRRIRIVSVAVFLTNFTIATMN